MFSCRHLQCINQGCHKTSFFISKPKIKAGFLIPAHPIDLTGFPAATAVNRMKMKKSGYAGFFQLCV